VVVVALGREADDRQDHRDDRDDDDETWTAFISMPE
jgi:hypothetical protein